MNTIARLGAVAVTALAGTLAACHHAKTPTDAELTNLLRVQNAQPNDPAARIDPSAVDCLRAWSGDADLAKPLPPAGASDAAKKACRQRIDGWLADATRNPDKLAFEDVSAPPAVRQAIALQQQHRAAAGVLPAHGDQPPAAMMGQAPRAMAPGPAPTLPKGPVDVSAPAAELSELDGLCKQAKDAAAASSTAPIARYAPMCERRIAQLRERVNQLQTNG
ncbi:MAG TPA: hypothetical protein VI258_14950, partial [Rhodanobacteraceae bacterium]